MQETFKKLTAEIRAKLLEHLKTKELKEFMSAAKAAEDTGNFEVVISTADLDRQGEAIDQNGWELDFYKTNPIVLWAHDYYSLPIGITDEIKVENGQLIARGRFAPESANPFAQQVRRLYDLKIVRATSVGFIVKEAEGNRITKAELLEFSFVPVPANPFALSLSKAQALGLDTAMLALKGIAFKQDEPKEGDPCTMPDGAEGEMHPNESGEMVCMPKVSEKPEPETEGDYIIIRVKDPDYFDPDSFRTIDISAEQGIKATIGCKKGEYANGKCSIGTEVQRYLFDKEKWTLDEAQAWVDEHTKDGGAKHAGKICFDCAGIRKAKGEIADQVNQDEKRKQKWERLSRVWDIFDAFIGVYLNDATPVEDFTKLLDEAITLMKTETEKWSELKTGAVGAALAHPDRKRIIKSIKDKDIEKVGAELTALQSEVDNAIVLHSKKIIEIIETEYGEKINAASAGGAGEESANGQTPKQRSNSAGSDTEALNAWLQLRQVLRLVNNVTSSALEKINERNRKTQWTKKS